MVHSVGGPSETNSMYKAVFPIIGEISKYDAADNSPDIYRQLDKTEVNPDPIESGYVERTNEKCVDCYEQGKGYKICSCVANNVLGHSFLNAKDN